ncbi:RDD family protein [Fulvivirga ligni]|uniref:RDD family protein n=1 Tax=Fulvivirga ligni TaxID=2904246 RepID=UPI001F1F9B1C|nr:RDD family protein [Fulvivirga ligni]UII22260.1 RDD family protein [Fulvivirga ligni]
MYIEGKPDTGNRLGSMVLDHFVMTFIAGIFAIPHMAMIFAKAFNSEHAPPPDVFGPFTYIGLIGFVLYLCKDSFNGRSIGKRALKLQVVNYKTGEPAAPLRCLVRNLLCIIWPIEVIVTLINPNRRIGDMLAGTEVINYNPDHVSGRTRFGQILITFALASFVIILLWTPIYKLTRSIPVWNVEYSENSYNEQESKALEQIFENDFSEDLTADIKIYDEIKNSPGDKYISVILNLEEDLLSDDTMYASISDEARAIIRSQYPNKAFQAKVKFIYRGEFNMIAKAFYM